MTDAPHTVKVRLRVEGMDCASCAIKIETALHRLAGVSDVVVSVPAGTVIVTHDRRELEDRIRDRISGLGYQVTGSEQIGVKTPPFKQGCNNQSSDGGQTHSHIHDHTSSGQLWWQTRKGMLTIASGLTLAMAYVLGS